ncbi:2-hydroxyacyl-CoA dehydratase family protein [Streptomyces montanisoli]|uniref:2-hydroxyacyl-CoA dehydratase n=1 Tax=Streptomyces montanisoli TaxID=2798581 RepID=A0A940RY21_9ACTN|nr:2-hydroxyacyl-CoA dehydratase family protein [Streptomyces montanisoli]MBP0458723.1 2-hydroxyacyl-CoA dehydratase [Streptomyces montanisoli]
MPQLETRDAARLLDAVHDDRGAPAREWAAAGRPVVGYVGADTPVELVTAAGALPVRLAGRPGRDASRARTYLEGAVDPQVVNILAGLLDPGETSPDLVLITHESDASLQLFLTLRELRRTGVEALPPVHLLDLLHLPSKATARYNLGRVRRLADQMGAWRGRAIAADELEEAVEAHNRARAARAELTRRRATCLTGAECLRWYAAGTAMPPGRYADTLTEALRSVTGTPPATPRGRRLFVSGSEQDTADVYDALESRGWLVVGDDHSWGDGGHQPLLAAGGIEALTEHYTRAVLPVTGRDARRRAAIAAAGVLRSGAEVFLCYSRRYDDVHRWDFPGQRAAVGVPAALLRDQPYARADLAELAAGIGDPQKQVTS